MASTRQRDIVVRGARENNLQGVDVTIPRGSLTCVTGVSGSGKSSLAFDTIFKEGQRRFVESLSPYARQFLGNGEKPQVDQIDGLSPTVSIDQKTVARNPRSTVGTVTEIHDHLRLLFARLGTPHCPDCGKVVRAQSAEQIVDRVGASADGRQVMVLAPVVRERKGEYRRELEDLRSQGFVRARVDGAVLRLDEPIALSRYERHTIEVVLDRVKVDPEKRGRLAEAIEKGLTLGQGLVTVVADDGEVTYSAKRACPDCNVDLPELEPRTFSFNSPQGACTLCDGLGVAPDFDERLVIPDERISIDDGAVAPGRGGGFQVQRHLRPAILQQVCDGLGIPRAVPVCDLTKEQRHLLLFGDPNRKITIETKGGGAKMQYRSKDERVFEGVIPILRALHRQHPSKTTSKYLSAIACRSCGGSRLSRLALAVRFRDRSIGSLGSMTVADLRAFALSIQLEPAEQAIGERLLKELEVRLRFLERVGVGYLTVDRSAATLSGGEAQRIRLATQVGSRLRGILYVLDEPSIGLHARDNQRLIETLKDLRDAGNTVLVVEHDLETMESSDFLVDVGPGAGAEGGHIISVGTPDQVLRDPKSVTGAFLAGRETIEGPAIRRAADPERTLRVLGASAHNLKHVDVTIPIGLFTCVTGVSGSGKSTLVDLILRRELARHFHGAEDVPGAHDRIVGLEHLDKVIEIDQSPIGRTPRSNAATYTDVFGLIRDLFASLPEAQVRGYEKGRFSFNVKGGRCEECGGAGVRIVELQFLSDVTVPCEVCQGHRFNPETLEIRFRGRSIQDVLEMTVKDALGFFETHKKIARVLATLDRVGLGYVRLGQPSTTLSGGEAQRIKLAKYLHRPPTGRTLYLLDEPTTGLHFLDVRRLLDALQALVDAGNTVVVIEHDLDVVKCADWVIDLGPEGGAGGGELVYEGSVEGLMHSTASLTGQALVRHLAPRKPISKKVKKPPPVDRALDGDILIKKASLHNLQSLDVRIPAGSLTVVSGPSGSGKTSLAFDTLFAEGQRRFVECLSTYARQFLGRLDRPPVEEIVGLAPAIAIDQKNAPRNPRSTVATVTEIQDYLRLLFARVGQAHCPTCRQAIQRTAPDRVVDVLIRDHGGQRGRILSPLFRHGGKLRTTLSKASDLKGIVPLLIEQGFRRLLIDGEECGLEALPPSSRATREIWLVVDRCVVKPEGRTRLLDSVAQAYERGHGVMAFETVDGRRTWFSESPACVECGVVLPTEFTPRMFSFNSQIGACSECQGLGRKVRCDPNLLIARPTEPLFDGALIDRPGDFIRRSDSYLRTVVERMAEEDGVDLSRPYRSLPAAFRKAVMDGRAGTVDVKFHSQQEAKESVFEMKARWIGFRAYIERWHRDATSESWTEILSRVLREDSCDACEGQRLKPEFRAVRVGSTTIGAIADMTVEQAAKFFSDLSLEGSRATIAAEIVKELRHRLAFLSDVGLEYLGLGRAANSLSGGEAQRIRLATQIGNRLTGVLYVLDEPTVGLHPRDTRRLLETLVGLRDLGNTVVVVEHDRDTLDRADWILDLGPGAGRHGGRLMFQGTRRDFRNAATSTAEHLSGVRRVAEPREPRPAERTMVLSGVDRHNLRDVRVEFPRRRLVTVTGVSGSGKSTLVMESLVPALRAACGSPGGAKDASLTGADGILQCVVVDQAPIGSSPRSNPASYVEIMDDIRQLFADAPSAKLRGFTPGRFSFNLEAGRCGPCEGRGSVKIEMHFLPDVWVRCETCLGRRYNRETLEVLFKGKSIADVLAMDVTAAVEFFSAQPRIAQPLEVLESVGLGYLELGQPATTLSGGEAQRIKLARELATRTRGETVYVLDEPTTGLHFDDVAKLLTVLHRLVEKGHSVVVIEHNLDVILASDHVIDMGPEGGQAGGAVVTIGTPAEVARAEGSHTGRVLAEALGLVRGPTVAKSPRSANDGDDAPGLERVGRKRRSTRVGSP